MTDEEIMESVFGLNGGCSGVRVNTTSELQDVVKFLAHFGCTPSTNLDKYIFGARAITEPRTIYTHGNLIEADNDFHNEDTTYDRFFELRYRQNPVSCADYDNIL